MSILAVEIHRVPAADVPAQAPLIALSRPRDERIVAEQLLSGIPAVPPGEPFAALVRMGTLDSPDVATVIAAEMRENRVEVSVVVLDFQGILGANVQSVAVLELRFSPLPAGVYAIVVAIQRFGFSDPERAAMQEDLGASLLEAEFEVAAAAAG